MKQKSMKRKNRMSKTHNKSFEPMRVGSKYLKHVSYMAKKGIKRAVNPKRIY